MFNIIRNKIINRLVKERREKNHIIGVSVGSGISAKYTEKGGADLILVLSSGKFRQMGKSSLAAYLPFVNSNEMVMNFASTEIKPLINKVPIIFGFNSTDPTINMSEYIDYIKERGFDGINNYPTVGLIDGRFRDKLEEEGMGYKNEVEAIKIASKKGLFTIAFVFDELQAIDMLNAGADVICYHLGLTSGGILGAKKALSLRDCKEKSEIIFKKCQEIRPDVLKMIYGGPIETPIDIQYMYQNSLIDGYIGGSAFERIPLEKVLVKTTNSFKKAEFVDKNNLMVKMLENINNHYTYVEFVKKYISENYSNPIVFSDLAELLHVSRGHLSKLFKKEVGISFKEYLVDYRINIAKKLIIEEDIYMCEISNLVGYNDYSYFSRVFKNKTGLSPREYRNKYKFNN